MYVTYGMCHGRPTSGSIPGPVIDWLSTPKKTRAAGVTAQDRLLHSELPMPRFLDEVLRGSCTSPILAAAIPTWHTIR